MFKKSPHCFNIFHNENTFKKGKIFTVQGFNYFNSCSIMRGNGNPVSECSESDEIVETKTCKNSLKTCCCFEISKCVIKKSQNSKLVSREVKMMIASGI